MGYRRGYNKGAENRSLALSVYPTRDESFNRLTDIYFQTVYPAHNKASSSATSQPSPIGAGFVFGTPGERLGAVGGRYPEASASLSTPPRIEEATVFTVPLAMFIGAVE